MLAAGGGAAAAEELLVGAGRGRVGKFVRGPWGVGVAEELDMGVGRLRLLVVSGVEVKSGGRGEDVELWGRSSLEEVCVGG